MSPLLTILLTGFVIMWLVILCFVFVRQPKRAPSPALSKEERQGTIHQALQITEEDLVLNRQGILSDKQKRFIIRQNWGMKMLVLVFCFLMGSALINTAHEAYFAPKFIVESVPAILFFLVLLVAVLIFAFYFIYPQREQVKAGVVDQMEGKVVLVRQSWKGHKSYSLTIQSYVFEIPRTLFFLLDEEKIYRLFFLKPPSERLVGLEEIV